MKARLGALPEWDQSSIRVSLTWQSKSILHHTNGVLITPQPALPRPGVEARFKSQLGNPQT